MLCPQAKLFSDAVKITGVVLTKLDGTAKGGIIVRLPQSWAFPSNSSGLGKPMMICGISTQRSLSQPSLTLGGGGVGKS